jgi:hypothetical protein
MASKRLFLSCWLALGILSVSGCKSSQSSGTEQVLPFVEYDASAPMGACGAVEQQQSIEGYDHVDVCSHVTYGTNPPSSGNHYPIWAAYQSYTTPVPEGFWVHNLEHGSIVISYNCSDGCAADVAAAQQMIDSLAPDPVCTSLGQGVSRRIVMTPDPKLDVPFAASAWGWTLKAFCFDPGPFTDFANAHYDQGREDLCDQGEDVTQSAPAGCGS